MIHTSEQLKDKVRNISKGNSEVMAKDVDEIFMKNSKIYYPIYRKKNGVDVMALLFQKLSNSIKNVFKLKR